jgi:PAS domain S-box-containing protein
VSDAIDHDGAGDALRGPEALRLLVDARQAFLLKLSDALRPLGDASEIQAVTTHLVAEHFGVDRAMYAEVEGEHGAEVGIIRDQFVRPPTTAFPVYFAFGPFGPHTMEARYRGDPLVVDDVVSDPAYSDAERAAWVANDVRAAIVAPLAKAGRLVAEFGIHCAAARKWTEQDVALVQEVAERTWAAAERARAEAALRDSERRYRALFESMDQAYAVVDVLKDAAGNWHDFRFVEVNPAFMAHTGMLYPVGKTATELLATPNPRWTELYGKALDSGRALRVEETEHTLGIVLDLNIFTLDRARNRVAVLFTNITERKHAERALDESERRLRTLVAGVPQLVWRAVDGGHWTWASPQWTEYTGQSAADSLGQGWLEPVHPDDRDAARALWAGATERGEFSADYRICHAAEHRYRWFQTRATPVRGADGTVVEWLGTSTDVDDLRQLQERQALLVAELQHRVRNILTVVRSVFGRTIEAGGELEDIANHFRGRLDALARTQVVVTQTAAGDVDLEDLIREELLSVGVSDGEEVTISGPEVRLPPRIAETIGLAIHELTTNAIKYGALQEKRGELRIEWSANLVEGGTRHLRIRWTEQGVPAIPLKPSRYGFGMELIEEALPYRLGAETKLEFRGGGVRCTLSLPLPQEGP